MPSHGDMDLVGGMIWKHPGMVKVEKIEMNRYMKYSTYNVV
jgi:hypothetical protein